MALLIGVCAMAQSVDIDGIFYKLDATTQSATVTAGEIKYSGDIVIPATVTYEEKVYNVTKIGDAAFSDNISVNSVTLPEGVTEIGSGAFNTCMQLTSIKLPNSLTTIGHQAFELCVNLPQITIPENVTKIGSRAFYYCEALTSISIPKSVTTLGLGTFATCKSITSIEVDAENPNYTSVDGVLFDKNMTTLIQYPVGSANTSYTIPGSVTTIDVCAFESNKTLKTITLHNGVTTIKMSAFMNCDALTSIDIPESVTEIGGGSFYSCDALTSIAIHKNLTTIGEEAFALCNSATAINVAAENPNYSSADGVLFNKDMTTLIQYPLGNAAESYTIPDGVTTISEMAFYNCQYLTSVTIPASVTTISIDVFANSESIESITAVAENPNYASVDGVLFDKAMTKLIQYPAGKKNSTYTIPDGVTTIGTCAFESNTYLTTLNISEGVTTIEESALQYCTALTDVTIPKSMRTIGDFAFFQCDALTNITILEGLTTIGVGVFMDCGAIKSITLPESVTLIEDGTFYNCAALEYVICKSVTPPTITESAFPDTDKNTPIYVPAESIDSYKSAVGWREFTNILPIGQATAIDNMPSDNITVSFTGGNIVVSGTDDYTVYAINGQCLGKITNVESGIYIVVAEGKSYKVIAQ